MMFACPCCEYLTFEEEPSGTFFICPVCFWEDDNVQNKDPSYEGGANGISLRDARANFIEFGAVKKEFKKDVRDPAPEEKPSADDCS